MQYILPVIITMIIVFSNIKKKNAYDSFMNGVCDGMKLLKTIFPPLLAVITASSMLRASGAMEMILKLLSPAAEKLGIPSGVMPIALLRPISGGGSIGLLADILKSEGADTLTGRAASVIMGATETTFYCISVYFAKTRVKSTASILLIALFCDFVSVLAAVWAIRLF